MIKAANKLLAIVISFAMMLTGFTFLGGAAAVSADDGDKPDIMVQIDSANEQPATGGAYRWAFFGEDDSYSIEDFDAADFGMQMKAGDGEWADTSEATVALQESDEYTGLVIATVPDNTDPVEKQWRFTYAGNIIDWGGNPEDCPAITQAAGEDTPEPVTITVTFDAQGGTVEPASAEAGEDGKLASLPTPEKEGFAFVGWYTEASDVVTTDTVFEADATVKARWADMSKWEASDFTYGEYTLNTTSGSAGSDAVYPGDDMSTYLLPGTKNVITGFSEDGAAKFVAGKTELVLPATDTEGNTVQGVGRYAFSATNNAVIKASGRKVTEVTFPEGGVYTTENVADINEKWGPKGYLTDGSVEKIGDYYIGYGAFTGNELTEVDIPDGTIYINTYAFQNNKLTKVTIPSSVAIIGTGAFAGKNTHDTNAIIEVVFPEKTDIRLSIYQQAFIGNNIASVTLPQDTLKVAKWAFLMNLGSGETITDGNANENKGEIVTATMLATEEVSSLVCNRDAGTDKCMKLVVKEPAAIPVVTFDAQGGTVEPASAEAGEDGKLASLPTPEKEGFAFVGWYTEAGDVVTTDTVFEADTTVKAVWREMSPAETVEAAVEALPKDVTTEDKEAIEAAREAYDALSDEEKASLPETVELKIQAAEAKLAAAKAEAKAEEAEAAASAAQTDATQAKGDAAAAQEAAKQARSESDDATAKADLAATIVDAATSGVTSAKYTKATYNNFAKALSNAKSILKKSGATAEEFTAAGEALTKAQKALKKKAANTLKVKPKKIKVKAKALKKKAKSFKAKKAFTVSAAKGKVTYKKASGNKKITVASNGKIKVKKGLKKGTYKVKVNVKAAGDANTLPATKKVVVKVVVK